MDKIKESRPPTLVRYWINLRKEYERQLEQNPHPPMPRVPPTVTIGRKWVLRRRAAGRVSERPGPVRSPAALYRGVHRNAPERLTLGRLSEDSRPFFHARSGDAAPASHPPAERRWPIPTPLSAHRPSQQPGQRGKGEQKEQPEHGLEGLLPPARHGEPQAKQAPPPPAPPPLIDPPHQPGYFLRSPERDIEHRRLRRAPVSER